MPKDNILTEENTLITVGSASDWDPGEMPILNTTQVTKISNWYPGKHTASVQPEVITEMEVSNGVLKIHKNLQSHVYTPPTLDYSNKTITGAIADRGTSPSLTITQIAVATE